MAQLDSPPTASADVNADRYLELLKGCLTRELFGDEEWIDAIHWKPEPALGPPEEVWEILHRRGWRLMRPAETSSANRDDGSYPANAETMVGRGRLDNVQTLIRTVVDEGVPGDLVETGVWRGGTVIFMRAVLATLGVTDRTVWVCDSFQGLPEPDPERYPADASMVVEDAGVKTMLDGLLGVSVEAVSSNFERYGLLDDQVRFVEGWFKDSLPEAPIEEIALLRADGDLYESTMDTLVNLEPRVSAGGFVIIDDYSSIEACRQAVTDYRRDRGIEDEIVPIDWTGVYWRKGAR